MMNRIVDKNFGINSQALAVLNLMGDMVPDFANYQNGFYTDVTFSTRPWYNGRERGIVISMSLGYKKNIHIAFFEHRNSDSIHCLKWKTNHPYYNHPLEDSKIFDNAYSGDSKYDTAKSFLCGNIGECADWIYSEFEDFYGVHKTKKEGKL